MALLQFPADMFELWPGQPALYGHNSDIKRYADHLKELIGKEEWRTRRERVAHFFYESLIGEAADVSGKGRFYDGQDLFGWFLFLAEAINEHPQNYEVNFGCRVVPIFARLGADLDSLLKVEGYEGRLRRLVGAEKSQPNAGLFEFLVANAYASEGYDVAFHPEQSGRARTYDIDASKGKKVLAIECKRMGGGDYDELERERMRCLWRPACAICISTNKSFYLDVNFKTELNEIPDEYLYNIAKKLIHRKEGYYCFSDNFAQGTLKELDISPMQEALANSYWLHPGPQFTKKLLGSYRRYDNHLMALKLKYASNPHFVDNLSQAVVARWASLSESAIERKARDVISKVVDAHKQLPLDVPSVIHIGFDTLGGDQIEKRRYEKIKSSIQKFDLRGKPIEAILCNAFSPEASPEETWAIDETYFYHAIRQDKLPLSNHFLIIPGNLGGVPGVHWQ